MNEKHVNENHEEYTEHSQKKDKDKVDKPERQKSMSTNKDDQTKEFLEFLHLTPKHSEYKGVSRDGQFHVFADKKKTKKKLFGKNK